MGFGFMNYTSVGGIVKPWLIIKPDTVTLFVIDVGVMICVGDVVGLDVDTGVGVAVEELLLFRLL